MGLKQDLVAKRQELEAKQQKLHKVFEEAGDDLDFTKVTSLDGDTKAKVEKVRQMNQEMEELGIEVDRLADLVKAQEKTLGNDEPEGQRQMKHAAGEKVEQKTFGELFTESEAYKVKGKSAELDIEMKTLFETSAGWAPESVRTGKVVEYATRPIQVIDVIPSGRTGQAAVVYMEETTFTNNAAEVDEGGQYGEAVLALTERTSQVRKIAIFIPITDEQLEDVAQVQSYLNNRIRFMLRQRLDSQIINGDGSAPNLEGILNTTGIQSHAKTGDAFDSVYNALRMVRVTGRAIPNVTLFHPSDWQVFRLARTNDGLYILGNPDQAGPSRIWGLPVVETDALPEGTGLVGDFSNFIELTERRGIEVKVSDSHSDYFIKGKQALRADVRVALPVYRPAAFCQITGL